jgi:hypothetical protein
MNSTEKWLLAGLLGASIAGPAGAQHEGHHPTPTPTPAIPQRHEQSPPPHREEGVRDRNLFQSDMALMTGMTPRDPMGMAMPGWHVVALGIARLSYNRQGGPSGDSEIESSNWNMVHAQREVGPGRLSLMMMNSLEPATLSKRGSPQLFQSGESFRGEPLVDRQHPHDFFMNLSATYRLGLGPESAAWLQVAPVGEPVVGPTAFMHRASAGENPASPLGHHWQDSTHIAFNVITAGAGWRWLAVEGSAFHGSEPDDRRWDIEGGAIDSAAGRVRLFLGGGWSAQISHAFLREPEELEPGDTHRTTASLSYGAEGDRPLAAKVLWGRNDETHGTSDAVLLEAAWQATRLDHFYVRAEMVEKDLELLRTKAISEEEGERLEELVWIRAITVGSVRGFELLRGWKTGLGADLTAYGVPGSLESVYGDSPLSTHLFFRVRWGEAHGSSGGHAGH